MPFTLNHLLGALTPERRALIVQVRDPAGLAATLPITGARAFDLAEASHLVFIKNEAPDLVAALLASRARFVLARPEIVEALPAEFAASHALVLTPRPRLLLALLATPFDAPAAVSLQRERIHPDARIASSAVVAPGAVIGADVEIGPECVIGPNTVIDHAVIGARTRIDFNCSIGSDGFGYEIDDETGEIIKIPHFGRVLIGQDVEISSNVAIDRGSLRDTILEDQVKVDNLVHIAHNCHIKRGAFIIANTMIGGSTTVGEYAWIAPSTSLINGIALGRCAMTGLGAVVVKPVEANALMVGVPAKKLRDRFPEGHELL